jgi:hypothetical protein
MSVRCLDLASGRVDTLHDVAELRDFPYGSEYLRAPHWHIRLFGGFRQNIPKSNYAVAKVGA